MSVSVIPVCITTTTRIAAPGLVEQDGGTDLVPQIPGGTLDIRIGNALGHQTGKMV
jgi:hypothetical protein